MLESSDGLLVGRDREWGKALEILERVASEGARALAITGEPGIGKTTLARRMVTEAEDRGFGIAWSWCWAAAEAPPFWPWRQAARELGWGDLDWTDIASAFAEVSEPLRAGGPTLVVFDDAHGADESSLELVNLLVRSLRSSPLAIVLTICEEDVPQSSRVAHLLDEISRGGDRLDLYGLDKAATAALLKQTDEVPPLIQDAIASASDGNPFLIEQLAREVSSGRDLNRPDRSLGFNVPRGAEAVLERVIRRLSPEALETLTVASVLGRTFTAELLAEVGGARTERTLAEAMDKGAVKRLDSLGTYAFAHALLRERLYEDLEGDRRQALHLSAAQALERRSDPTLLTERAQHLFKAGTRQPDVGRAVEVIVAAAREAEAAGSPDGSARLLYRAARLARAAGMADLATDIETQRDDTRPDPEPDPVARPGLTGTFKKEGEYWSIGLGGDPVLMKHSKGMGYLASLLSTPQKEWHCLELASPARREERPQSGDTGPLLDAQAKKEFRQRLLDLEEEIAEATEFNDDGRLRRAEEEKQFLMDELAAATGLGGRDRTTGSDSERARVAVTRAIRSALRRISAAHAGLGDHLDRTIQTGTFLSYRPDPMATPDWKF